MRCSALSPPECFRERRLSILFCIGVVLGKDQSKLAREQGPKKLRAPPLTPCSSRRHNDLWRCAAQPPA
jgi:hypothetical protein